jgi:5-methylcytosine-specific restriction endonuclease McrA
MSFRENVVKTYQSYAPKKLGGKRSRKWPKVRKAYVKKHPLCEACGSKRKPEVHHIEDFSTNPALELDPANLITLCRAGCQCHLSFGHLGSWKSINPNVGADSARFLFRVENRR